MTNKWNSLGHWPFDARPGDVIAVRSHGFSPVSWIIRKRTVSQINHVASVVRDENVVEALGKVIRRPLIKSVHDQWWIHLRPNLPLSQQDIGKMVDFLEAQVGKGYDWKGVLGFGPWNSYNRDNANPDKWFCSELVWASFNHIGQKLVNKPEGYVSPLDILECNDLYVVGYQWPKELMDWIQ